MMDTYLSPKFGVNPLDSFWESGVYGQMNGRMKDVHDGRPCHNSNSAVQ